MSKTVFSLFVYNASGFVQRAKSCSTTVCNQFIYNVLVTAWFVVVMANARQTLRAALNEYSEVVDVSGAFDAVGDSQGYGEDGNGINTYRLKRGFLETGYVEGHVGDYRVEVTPEEHGELSVVVEGGTLEDVEEVLEGDGPQRAISP